MTSKISIQTILKVAAISIGAAVLALTAELASRHQAWSSVGAWLRPPYIHVVVNGIIISIAAASRFRDHQPDEERVLSTAASVEEYRDERDRHGRQVVISLDRDDHGACDADREIITVEVKEVIKEDDHDHDHDHEPVMTMMMKKSMRSMDSLPKRTFNEEEEDHSDGDILKPSTEKHLISPKLKSHRKPAKTMTTREGGVKISKPKVQPLYDTLEDTWKAITEGRSTPLTRQMKKSETFNDRTNHDPPAVPSPPLRRDTSLSPDELNERVEAFIKKFNEEIRLQRQKSLNEHLDVTNHGTHY